MKTKSFLASFLITDGEVTYTLRYLALANSHASAEKLMDTTAACFFGEPEDVDALDGGYECRENGRQIKLTQVREIGLSTFLELKDSLPVRRTADIARTPSHADLDEDVQVAAQALTRSLNSVVQKSNPEALAITHSAVLNALAASWGVKNWQVLKAKLKSPNRTRLAALLQAADNVVSASDSAGCSDDLTVTEQSAVEALQKALAALGEAGDLPDTSALGASKADNKSSEVRQDVVEAIVVDVKARALRHCFSISKVRQAFELAGESAATLGILGLTRKEQRAAALALV